VNKKTVQTAMAYEFEKKEAATKAGHEKEVIQLEAQNRIDKTKRNYVILATLLALLSTTIALVYYNNRKSLKMQEHYSHQLILSQEQERQRISKELHDSVGQNMLFIKNQMIKNSETRLLPSVDETLEEIRSISKDLYPNQLEKYGLIAAVEALSEKIKDATGIFVSHDLEALAGEIPSDKRINIYRIIQECVSNAMKHSSATALRITATAPSQTIELAIQDNGKGFDKHSLKHKAQKSFGVLNMEERVKLLNGRAEVESSPGNGTKWKFYFSLQ
jgi:signal transduction histidine kinase